MLISLRHVAATLLVLFALTAGQALAQFGPPRSDPPNNPTPPNQEPQPNPNPNPNPNPGGDNEPTPPQRQPIPNPNPNPNPNPQPGPNPPAADPNVPLPDIRLPGNPANPAGNANARPDWLKPGVQVTYATSDGYSPNINPNLPRDQQPKASAGMGYREYTVIALTDEKVYLQHILYLAPQGLPLKEDGSIDMTVDPKAQLGGLSFQTITGLELNQGDAIWMSPARLQAMEQKRESNADGTQGSWVDPTSWPYNGQLVNAVKIETWGENYAHNRVFNRDNGMLMFYHSAIGGVKPGSAKSNIYAKEMVDLRQLVHTEQLVNPLIGAPFPDWTKQVKAMHYTGQQAYVMQGAQPISLPMTLTLTVDQNDGQLMLGKVLIKQQGVEDQKSDAVMGPGTFLGYWVNPQAMAQLRPGVIHRNAATRTFVTYQIEDTPLGRLGVFVHTNEAQNFFAVNAYDPQDGKLVYMRFAQPEFNMIREFQLQNIERR